MFLDHGAELVLMLEPGNYAELLAPCESPRRLGLQDTFESPNVLPGFNCRVRDVFPEIL
jgi:hypothetical protein